MRRWRDLAGYVGIRATVALVFVAVLFQVALRAWRGPTHQHSTVYVNLMLALLFVSLVALLIDRVSRFAALMVSAWGSWLVLVTLALLDIDRGQYPIILSLLAGGGAILGTTIGKRWMFTYLVLTVLALVLAAITTGQYDGATVAAMFCIGSGIGAWLLGNKFDELDREVSDACEAANEARAGIERLSNVVQPIAANN